MQVEAIKRKRRKTELEKVLSVFEPGKKHEISIDEDDYPERYRPIIRRLLKAVQDDKMRETMEIEDEILEDLQAKERELEQEREARQREAEARKRAEKEKKKEVEARQKAEEEKKRAEEKMKGVMKKLAIKMLEAKEPIEKIVEETGLSEGEIKKL